MKYSDTLKIKKTIFNDLTPIEKKMLEKIVDNFRFEGHLSIRHLEAIKELIDEAIQNRYAWRPFLDGGMMEDKDIK